MARTTCSRPFRPGPLWLIVSGRRGADCAMPIEGFRPDCAKPAAAGSPTRPAGSALDALRRDRLDALDA
jgi:hypothetical protein